MEAAQSLLLAQSPSLKGHRIRSMQVRKYKQVYDGACLLVVAFLLNLFGRVTGSGLLCEYL